MRKKRKCWGILCLAISSILPSAGFCNTEAYAPSIPGQPLIFHHNTKEKCLFSHKIFHELSSENIERVLKLSRESIGLSEALLGLIEIMFLQIDPSIKGDVAAIYNEEIAFLISEITHTFNSEQGHTSKKLSKLMGQTLHSFAQITNQMLVDRSLNVLFQQDYLEMQEEVINYFNTILAGILKGDRQKSFADEAESALEGLVSCMALYISNLNTLTNGNYAGPRSVVLSRQQIIQNLTLFVDSTFALVLTNCNK
jgi:hypothetical protein